MTKKYHSKLIFPIVVGIVLAAIIFIIFLISTKKTAPEKQIAYTLSPDTTIRPSSGSYAYENSTNKFKTQFKKNPTTQDGVSFANPIGSISFFTPRSQPFGELNDALPKTQANTITYSEIFSGVDLRYTVSQSRLLEEFIVKDAATAVRLARIKQLATTDSTFRRNDDGSIIFTENKKVTFSLPKPVMYEINNTNVKSYGIKYEINYTFNGELTISKVISPEGIAWLNDPSRQYPIAIDLVIDNADTAGNWVSSDAVYTVVSQETTIKQEGTGSVKIQTTAENTSTLDLMEYSSDGTAQAAYVTNALTSATGGSITTSGGDTINTFTGSGTFTPNGPVDVTLLVVAGGGYGQNNFEGGLLGGGGGGGASETTHTLSAQGYAVTVGGAGGGSSFGALVSKGAGGSGGSTGGTSGDGYSGGTSDYAAGGGGGGDSGVGGNGDPWNAGSGGPGLTSSISGSSVGYAGGGGGAGADGRGWGSSWGGGYGRGGQAGNGGQGIVIVRYLTPPYLQSYSEATIKTQGTYALKGIANITTSLNKTLIRTIASPVDLSNRTIIPFDIRASRTGSNIKIGLRDSGGTITEVTPNITQANTYQTASFDLSAVANVNKDAIDQIIITILNADATNTFYLDNMISNYGSLNDTVTLTTSPLDLSSATAILYWVRSSITGSFGRFQFGESTSTEQTNAFTISSANTWEQKVWNISGITGTARDAVTKFALQFTSDTQGATIYFDYTLTNTLPNTPTLDLPINTATNQILSPVLKTTATDPDSDYLRYKIQICTDLAMTLNCQTFDQTSSQTGWSGQNAQTSTAYTSGTQATYTIQAPLVAATTYYWRSYAIDPGGSNTWSGTQTPYSFTTTTAPTAPTTPYTQGSTNPTGIATITPYFSAIHNDGDGDSANKYEINVNTNSGFTGTVMWNSGQVSMTTTANGVRSPNLTYAGTIIPLDGAGTTYYWRIRFTDVGGAVGAWSATQNFTMNQKPAVPTLDLPVNSAIDQALAPVLKTTTSDSNSDYLRYKIQICTNVGMTSDCQTFDQTSSQTGWSGQNTQSNTAYTSGTQTTYTIQSPLLINTNYYWRSYAADPGGSNNWSNTQTPYSFTTVNIIAPSPPTSPLTNGLSNPTGVLTSTLPYFSAIHNDLDNQSANYYQIKVSNQPDVNGAILWDSGQVSMTSTANGARSPNITYAGNSLPLNGQTFYWKIHFWDTEGNAGAWSSPAGFTLFSLFSPASCMAIKNNQNTQITINWLDRTSSEDGYYIEKNTDGAGFTNLITKAADSVTHVDSSVSSSHSYQYRVRSKTGSDYSDWCTTTAINLATGNFKMNGLQLNGVQIY